MKSSKKKILAKKQTQSGYKFGEDFFFYTVEKSKIVSESLVEDIEKPFFPKIFSIAVTFTLFNMSIEFYLLIPLVYAFIVILVEYLNLWKYFLFRKEETLGNPLLLSLTAETRLFRAFHLTFLFCVSSTIAFGLPRVFEHRIYLNLINLWIHICFCSIYFGVFMFIYKIISCKFDSIPFRKKSSYRVRIQDYSYFWFGNEDLLDFLFLSLFFSLVGNYRFADKFNGNIYGLDFMLSFSLINFCCLWSFYSNFISPALDLLVVSWNYWKYLNSYRETYGTLERSVYLMKAKDSYVSHFSNIPETSDKPNETSKKVTVKPKSDVKTNQKRPLSNDQPKHSLFKKTLIRIRIMYARFCAKLSDIFFDSFRVRSNVVAAEGESEDNDSGAIENGRSFAFSNCFQRRNRFDILLTDIHVVDCCVRISLSISLPRSLMLQLFFDDMKKQGTLNNLPLLRYYYQLRYKENLTLYDSQLMLELEFRQNLADLNLKIKLYSHSKSQPSIELKDFQSYLDLNSMTAVVLLPLNNYDQNQYYLDVLCELNDEFCSCPIGINLTHLLKQYNDELETIDASKETNLLLKQKPELISRIEDLRREKRDYATNLKKLSRNYTKDLALKRNELEIQKKKIMIFSQRSTKVNDQIPQLEETIKSLTPAVKSQKEKYEEFISRREIGEALSLRAKLEEESEMWRNEVERIKLVVEKSTKLLQDYKGQLQDLDAQVACCEAEGKLLDASIAAEVDTKEQLTRSLNDFSVDPDIIEVYYEELKKEVEQLNQEYQKLVILK